MGRPQNEIDALDEKLSEAKMQAKLALESLINQAYREIRNLDENSDERMLIATGDLKYHWEDVDEKATDLEDAFNVLCEAEEWEPEDDTEDSTETLGLEPRGRA